jgi:hypothetical protein
MRHKMTRNARIASVLLGSIGTISFLLGALLAVRAAFGSGLYDSGLVLHLLGIAGCLGAIRLWVAPPGRPTQQGTNGSGAAGADTGMLRSASFRGRTQAVRAMAWGIVCVFGVLSLGMTARNLGELLALRRSGRLTEAQVFNKEPEVQLGNATTGLVYYSFRIQRRSVTGRFRAQRADYPLLRTGRHLTVTYLPADPGIHRLGLVDTGRVLREGAATLLLLLCGGVYIVAPAIVLERAWRRELRLARCGVETEGAIVGCRPHYRSGKPVAYDVRYEFELPGGRTLRGAARIGHMEGEPTLIGFPIAVLYDPARPEHHRPSAALRAIRFGRLPQRTPAV